MLLKREFLLKKKKLQIGWFLRGTRPTHKGAFCRTDRISFLSFLGVSGMLDSVSVEGTFSRKEFFSFLQTLLKKGIIEQYPGRNSIWIMDGARIHIDPEIVNYLFSVGVLAFFLPAYCPFYNPIKFMFSMVKHRCEKVYHKRGTEEEVLGSLLFSLMDHSFGNTFTHCGYHPSGFFMHCKKIRVGQVRKRRGRKGKKESNNEQKNFFLKF